MQISAAVTTAPRAVDYLPETLASLRLAGFDPVVVRDEGPRLGIVPTFRRALQTVADSAPLCAVFQDDIAVPVDLRERLDNLPSWRGVFALYLSVERYAPDGWSVLGEEGYPMNVGGCGFAMDSETAQRMLADHPFQRIDRLGSQIAIWCRRNSLPLWLHSPSLLEHRGLVSCRENVTTPERT